MRSSRGWEDGREEESRPKVEKTRVKNPMRERGEGGGLPYSILY